MAVQSARPGHAPNVIMEPGSRGARGSGMRVQSHPAHARSSGSETLSRSRSLVRFCFPNAATADAFRERFGRHTLDVSTIQGWEASGTSEPHDADAHAALYSAHQCVLKESRTTRAPWRHAMYYNFVRIHQALKLTPAMAASVTSRLWEMSDIVDVLEAWERLRMSRAA